MNPALIIFYVLVFINLLLAAHYHGKEKGKWNFWITLLSSGIELVIIWWMLGFKVWF